MQFILLNGITKIDEIHYIDRLTNALIRLSETDFDRTVLSIKIDKI